MEHGRDANRHAAAFCYCHCRYIFVEVPHGVFPLSEILAGEQVILQPKLV
jgi:hypothetical protein